MRTNKRMDLLIGDMHNNTTSNIRVNLSQLLKLLDPTFKNVHGCLIIDNNNENEPSEVNFERILKIHSDKTGYEASCNEVRINDFIESEDIEIRDLLSIGFTILDIWALKLKKSYPSSQFCLIISCHEKNVFIRFHQVRENEQSWLLDELEKYKDTAIAVITV